MHIYGPAHLHGAHPVNPPHAARPSQAASPSQPCSIQDELDLSPEARAADLVSEAKSAPEIRQDRVSEIRAQIAAGTYETDEKLEIAVGRLLDELG